LFAVDAIGTKPLTEAVNTLPLTTSAAEPAEDLTEIAPLPLIR